MQLPLANSIGQKAAADSGTLVCLPPAHHPGDFSTVPTTDPLHPRASDRQDAFFAHSTKVILARYSTIRREPDSVGRNAKPSSSVHRVEPGNF